MIGLPGLLITLSRSAGPGAATEAAGGVGIAGTFVAAALLVHLGYLDLLTAADVEESYGVRLRAMLLAVILPLLVTFGGMILFESLRILGFV